VIKQVHPVDYWAVFSTKQGQLVLEDLQQKFLLTQKRSGIDRMLDAVETQKAMEIMNYILSNIDAYEAGEQTHENEYLEISPDE